MKNHEVAKILYEIGEYLDIQNVAFKPRAYEKAAQAVDSLQEPIEDTYQKGGIKALKEIPGVGESIAEKIEEYLKRGRVKEYEALKKKMPFDLSGLTQIEGLGPKNAFKLYQKLGVKTVADLKKAIFENKVAKIGGFGQKSQEKLQKGINFLEKSSGRFLLTYVLPEIREVAQALSKVKDAEKVVVAGSVRRFKETVGDADILVVSKKPGPIMDFFVSLPQVARVLAHGETKSAITLKNGLNVDVRVVEAKSFGAALAYFTGSKDHNIAMREIAIKKGLKLNEYGIFRRNKYIAGKTEEEVYKTLGLDFIEPELRENTGELEAAKKHQLPNLIGYDDLQGDLQVQSDWTDGRNSIEEMAKAAQKRGLKYIAITDHTKSLAMTGGLDEKKLLKQMAYIDKLNKKLGSGFKILKGSEVNINKDGSLDIKDEVLAKLEVVGIAIHSHFNLSKKEQTGRIKKAMANPHADILFHPTGRIVLEREPYQVDMDEIFKTAKKTGTVLEINASNRLDLKDEYIKKAVEQGIKLAINSDAHSINHFYFLEFGIAQARRGWATKADIINTWPLKKILKILK